MNVPRIGQENNVINNSSVFGKVTNVIKVSIILYYRYVLNYNFFAINITQFI